MGKNAPELGSAAAVTREVFGCRPDEVAENVIVTPFVPLKAFLRHTGGPVADLAPRFFFRGFTGFFGDKPISVILTGVGPSRVGDCLAFLSLTPARRVLFVGAVGGLAAGLSMGDFFLPTEASDGEGYARYLGRAFEDVVDEARTVSCGGGLEADLGAFLRGRGLPLREGRVFTIGGVAFESQGNLELLVGRGFDALEMELSSFYAAAAHHGLRAAALTYVSDLPLRSSLWAPKAAEEEEALRSAWRALPLLALQFLSSRSAS